MNLQTIILATDFSPHSEVALEYASAVAAAENAKLLLVYVDDLTPGLVRGNIGYGYIPDIDEIAREQYDKLATLQPTEVAVAYEHHFLRGNAADELIRFAKEQRADLIVIGTQGRTGVTRLVMGSVAEEVVRRSPCPVMTVRLRNPSSLAPASLGSHEFGDAS